MKESPSLVHVYAEDTHYQFAATTELADSYFGGPHSMRVRGVEHGPEAIHQMVLLSPTDIPLLRRHHMCLPLLYGMRFSGCRMKYCITSFENIEILEISPEKSSSSWPYPDYPKHLPYVQLELKGSASATWQEFAEQFPNAPEEMLCDVFIAVPPPGNIGISLWGRDGDLGLVNVVWEFDANSKTVRAYNICT